VIGQVEGSDRSRSPRANRSASLASPRLLRICWSCARVGTLQGLLAGEPAALAETLPWTLAEIEDATALVGEDWHPNGVAANRKMIQAFLDEEVAQGLIAQPLSVEALFSEFEGAVKV